MKRPCSRHKELNECSTTQQPAGRLIAQNNRCLSRVPFITIDSYHTTISISGRSLCSLFFAYNIDLMPCTNSEMQSFTNRLKNSANVYSMETSTDKNKVKVFPKGNRKTEIFMNAVQFKVENLSIRSGNEAAPDRLSCFFQQPFFCFLFPFSVYLYYKFLLIVCCILGFLKLYFVFLFTTCNCIFSLLPTLLQQLPFFVIT